MTGTREISIDEYHVPGPLKEYDVWVVWCPDLGKTARAPWQEGHMYPAEWAEDKPVNPRTTYNQASATASLSPERLADSYPFPPDTEPANVEPTILIPPAKVENDLLFVDLDDVIVDGEMSEEAWGILQQLGGYAEVSRSFADTDKDESGAHAWVRGELPEGYGKVIADLSDRGQLELYDRGRMTGCTWKHIDGTPTDTVPNAQDTIESLVEKYAPEPTVTPKADGGATTSANRTAANSPNQQTENAYYQLEISDVADTGAFSAYRTDARNPAHDDWQGPHPDHGATSTGKDDVESSNFHVDPKANCWHCFAHDSGGGPLALIGVLEGVVSCRRAKRVYHDRQKLLKTCLLTRDKYAPGLDGETPPYEALIAVAETADLGVEDSDENILGKATYNVAKRIYNDIEPSDVD